MADGNYPPTGAWSATYFGCFQDIPTCCCGYFFPCVLAGRIAEIADSGSTGACQACCICCCVTYCCFGLGCLYSHGFRMKLRRKYDLPEEPCMDMLAHLWWFMCCGLIQEYRELKDRGWNPAIGYDANKRRNPPPQQFMT
ncbi:hypothetical protein CLOM_g15548 [Closterium sp. NIES-68]|nr:hypothetical protein CLOM_g15548 [Closterium sp. NIES-68]